MHEDWDITLHGACGCIPSGPRRTRIIEVLLEMTNAETGDLISSMPLVKVFKSMIYVPSVGGQVPHTHTHTHTHTHWSKGYHGIQCAPASTRVPTYSRVAWGYTATHTQPRTICVAARLHCNILYSSITLLQMPVHNCHCLAFHGKGVQDENKLVHMDKAHL